MSVHKLTPGDGYTYLTRQVAAADATHLGHTSLGDFYAAKGESPGVWAGSGLSGLTGVEAGGPVSAAQMKALFGEGRHPNADTIGAAMIAAGHCPAAALRASRLGRAFYTYRTTAPLRVAVARGYAAHNASVGAPGKAAVAADVRSRIRTEVGAEMFADAHGRPPANRRELSGFIAGNSRMARNAVAGFDLSFSPVKSVSALWAIAPPEVAAQIQQAQHCAVANTLGWLERDVAFTRDGDAGIRQIDVTGLVAALFMHRDSRAGDPDLHTHVVVSNKVQTLDGAWLALFHQILFTAATAACERYDTRIEAEMIARLGVRFEARPCADPSKRPVREVVGVDPALNAFWSSRLADITARRQVLVAAFQVERGRPPSVKQLGRLNQRANLETRPAKHSPRSYADQRAAWQAQAEEVMGGGDGVEAMLAATTGSCQPHLGVITAQVTQRWVGQTAEAVVAKISGSHPAWQVWHVRAEAERATRFAGVALADLDDAVDRVVAQALSPAHSVPLSRRGARPGQGCGTGPEPAGDQGSARRRDGTSVYITPGAARFTSRSVIDAGTPLIAAASGAGEPATVSESLKMAPAADGVALNPAQPQTTARMTNSVARQLPGPPQRPRPPRAR